MKIACLFLFIFATLVRYSVASCGRNGEYLFDDSSAPPNITEFQMNLDSALNQLPTDETQIRDYSFTKVYLGVDPNAAYTQARCIGYVDFSTCHNCIKDATAKLTRDCSKEAPSVFLLYNDYCMVRYSYHNMYGVMQMRDDIILFTNNTADVEPSSNISSFSEARMKLFDKLASETESIPSQEMVAVGKWYDGSSNMTIYGAVACSWDLSTDDCGTCLKIVNKKLGEYFDGKVGGSIIGPSCNFRYEIYNFITDTSLAVDDFSRPFTAGKSSNRTKTIIIAVVASIATIMVFSLCFCIFLKKRKVKKRSLKGSTKDQSESGNVDDIKMVESLHFDFSTVSTATDNFSDENKLGFGGFGIVYKGILSDGREIAVKRLSENSHQGEIEFKNEVMLVAKLQHRNLVRLLGFCYKQNERLLMYEYMTNSSLDNFIFDPVKQTILDWDKRYKIIGGIARGLLYLHEDSRLRIIHRDLKASNVLLDDEMNAKISDFGMARLFVMDETHGSTNRIVGTYGYMAPEYAMHGHFSVKSDVFSFGVLILEVVCGQKNNYFCKGEMGEDLLTFTWNSWRQGRAVDLVDPSLMSATYSTREIMRYIHIGLLCVQENHIDRPTMAQVVTMLTSTSLTLPLPSQPAFFLQSNASYESSDSKYKFLHSSADEASITEVYPR